MHFSTLPLLASLVLLFAVSTLPGIVGALEQRREQDTFENVSAKNMIRRRNYSLLSSTTHDKTIDRHLKKKSKKSKEKSKKSKMPKMPKKKNKKVKNAAPSSVPAVWEKIGTSDNGLMSGESVSMSANGKIIAVGEPNVNEGQGKVSIYQFDKKDRSWFQMGEDINGEAAGDLSGDNISMSANGEIIAIGADSNYDQNGVCSGHVRVYQFDKKDRSWVQMGEDIDGEADGDSSGGSVSLSDDGNIVAIGAYLNDGINGVKSGQVRVYQFDKKDSSWVQMGEDIDGEADGDSFGRSVSLSADGNIIAIGADGNNGDNGADSGHVRVYHFEEGNSAWVQMGEDIDGQAAYDYSGESVSLANSGNIIAIGARWNDTNNGAKSGHVRVYQFEEVNSAWVQMGEDIDGEAAYDYSGRSVSLANDGNIIAIGAPNNDGNNSNSGHVRVYSFNTSSDTWVLIGGEIDGGNALSNFGRSVTISGKGDRVVAAGLDGIVGVYELN